MPGTTTPHPFDPLDPSELDVTVSVVKKAHGDVIFKGVSVQEPRKAEMLKWLETQTEELRPARIADVTVIAPGGKVYDGLVDIKNAKILEWKFIDGVQPIVGHPTTHPRPPRHACSSR